MKSVQKRGISHGSAPGLAPAILLLVTACSAFSPERAPPAAEAEIGAVQADLHRDQGMAALEAGRHGDAAASFNQVLKAVPGDQEARLGLGEALLGQGELDEARSTFEKIDETAPKARRARALQGQGIVWLRQGSGETARRLLERAIELDARLWRSWNALGRLHDGDRDHQAARVAYRRAIELNPKAALLHNNLGFSLLASGEPVYAEASFRKALELDPTLEIASTNLRLALALQGRYGPALAGAAPSKRAVIMNNVGYAALLRGDHGRARSLFMEAMATDPAFFGEARRNLAFLDTLDHGRRDRP